MSEDREDRGEGRQDAYLGHELFLELQRLGRPVHGDRELRRATRSNVKRRQDGEYGRLNDDLVMSQVRVRGRSWGGLTLRTSNVGLARSYVAFQTIR